MEETKIMSGQNHPLPQRGLRRRGDSDVSKISMVSGHLGVRSRREDRKYVLWGIGTNLNLLSRKEEEEMTLS